MSDDFKLDYVPGSVDWTTDDSRRYLTDHPLPPDCTWKGRRPLPSHANLKGGYGKWLAETPYHQGLFEVVHAYLVQRAAAGDGFPTPDDMAAAVQRAEEAERNRPRQAGLF